MANFKHIAATLALLGSASFAVTGCGDKKDGTEVPGGDSAVEKAEGSCSGDSGDKAEGSCSGEEGAEASCSGEGGEEGGDEAAEGGEEEAEAADEGGE